MKPRVLPFIALFACDRLDDKSRPLPTETGKATPSGVSKVRLVSNIRAPEVCLGAYTAGGGGQGGGWTEGVALVASRAWQTPEAP